MATSHLISIEEYLSSDYEPDVDYVDGRIEERNMGETDHAKLQKRLLILLSLREQEWGVEAFPKPACRSPRPASASPMSAWFAKAMPTNLP